MPTPIFSSTLASLVRDLADSVGEIVPGADGTATSGSATTLADTALPWTDDANPMAKGAWVYVWQGANIGVPRVVSSYTGATRLATVSTAWASAIDTTSKYIFTRRFPGDYERAVRRAARYVTLARIALKPIIGREIVLGNALLNGSFDLFTTANVPDSWTKDQTSTFTSELTLTSGGPTGIKMVTDGTNTGFLRQSPLDIGRFNGISITARGRIYTTTAGSRVSLQLTDGISTATATHGGGGWAQLETPSLTVAANATKLQASIEVTAGAAVTVYASLVYIQEYPSDRHWYDINANQNVVLLEGDMFIGRDLWDATGDRGTSVHRVIGPSEWEITRDGTRRIRLHLNGQYNQRMLEYRGWANHADLSTSATAWTGSPQIILPRARYYLILETVKAVPDRFEAIAQERIMAQALTEAQDVEKRLQVPIGRGFKAVEVQ